MEWYRKHNKGLLRNRHFTGMLFTNFGIMCGAFVVMLVSLSLLAYSFAVRSVQDQLGETNQAYLTRQVSQVETYIQSVRLLLLGLASNPDVTNYIHSEILFTSDYEQIQRQNRIISLFRTNSIVNDHIDNLFLYGENADWVLTSNRGAQAAPTFVDQTWYPLYEHLLHEGRLPPIFRINPDTGAYSLTVLQQVPIMLKNSTGVIIANINCRKLFADASAGAPVYATNAEGVVIGSFRDNLLGGTLESSTLPASIWREEGNHFLVVDSRPVLITVCNSNAFGWWFYMIDTLDQYNARLGQYKTFFIILLCFALPIAVALAYLLSIRMFMPVKRILRVLGDRADEAEFPLDVAQGARNEIALLTETILHTLDRNKELTQTLAERMRRLNQAHLRMLQSQINPHFLYNTLATIHWMALEQLPQGGSISEALCTLSDLLRESIKSPEVVPLRDELTQALRYILLQKLRFEDDIDAEMRISDDCGGCGVPSMLLQPLIENAIKHGMSGSYEKPLHIVVTGIRDGSLFDLRVADDGAGLSEEHLLTLTHSLREENVETSHAIGLINVRQRLRLLFGDQGVLDVQRNIPTGLEVRIRLPFVEIGDN
ncbi:hypothetical protein AGMMS49992_10530 [Clostridia bacterium]|nr:hypothetical protein AGMMS49992_10530 [Clostridia bacterium]